MPVYRARVPHFRTGNCPNEKFLIGTARGVEIWYTRVMENPLERTVLDHGKVELRDSMADDLSVVNSARVSFSVYKDAMERQDEHLIHFLMREKHGTPFEHAVFKFYIKCPIFVAREWMRHRISSYNEMSMRYYVPENIDFYVPEMSAIRSQTGKPGSYDFEEIAEDGIKDEIKGEMAALYDAAYESYQTLLDLGVAKELARSVLPVGQYTEFIWTVNARSLMNFISLRNSSNAQHEIREYAVHIEEIFGILMPVTYNAFIEHRRVAP